MTTPTSESRPILVTGAAGFIGHHVCARLLARGRAVVGVDSFDPYYDPQLKRDRVAELQGAAGFSFQELDLADPDATRALFEGLRPERVVHLAAAVGVRASLEQPDAYVRANVAAMTHVLEGCRRGGVAHLVFASSSSVYGLNSAVPFRESHPVDHPISLYAATKRAGELMAHTWAHLYALPVTGLRFFTVYGPWGRPDMALFHFTRKILAGEPIPVFNRGDMRRDFTYVGDVAESVVRLLDHPPTPGGSLDRPDSGAAPFRLLNVGNNAPVPLMDFIRTIEAATGLQAELELLPMQPGDVQETYADSSALAEIVDFKPDTPLEVGVRAFVEWYRSYYGV